MAPQNGVASRRRYMDYLELGSIFRGKPWKSSTATARSFACGGSYGTAVDTSFEYTLSLLLESTAVVT
jgi:hypothetical protein